MNVSSHLPKVFSTNGKRQVQEVSIGIRRKYDSHSENNRTSCGLRPVPLWEKGIKSFSF